MAVLSGVFPKASVRATSAGNAERSVCVDRIGPAAPRRRAAPASVATPTASPTPPGVPRPGAGAARVTIRGLRQTTTGVIPDLGFTSVYVRYTFPGPGVTGAPRPRPARAPKPYE